MLKYREEYLHRMQGERQAEDKEPVLNFYLIPGALFHHNYNSLQMVMTCDG